MYIELIKNAVDFATSQPLGLTIGCNCGGFLVFRTDNPGVTPAVGAWWIKFTPGGTGSDVARPHQSFSFKVKVDVPFTLDDERFLQEGNFSAIHDTPADANAGYLHVFGEIRDQAQER